MKYTSKTRQLGILLAAVTCLFVPMAHAQAPIGGDTYAAKIYHVNYGYYPIVEAYIRTWDSSQEPLVNLNIANIGLQVKGRNYVPETAVVGNQYSIETLERRAEGFRTVVVLDASGTMRGKPFSDALAALTRFVEAKRPVDQVAVLAIRDTNTGYEVVSNFESNPTYLYQRIGDVRPDGQQTRLYDTVAAALQMCATAFRGDLTALEYAVLSTIVVLSDGKDEGSAITREELINRIGQLDIPVPIHSIAFTQIGKEHLRNIEALSTATFGRYWDLDDTEALGRTMQHVHRINRSDYVVTFRAYIPPDGESHTFRVGVEYPSGSGSFLFSSASFEAIESPAVFNERLRERYNQLLSRYPDNQAAAYGQQAGPAQTPPAPSTPQQNRQAAAEPQSDTSASTLDDATGEETATTDTDATPADSVPGDTMEDNEESDEAAAAFDLGGLLSQNGVQVALAGVGLLVVILLTMMWVRKGGKVADGPVSANGQRATKSSGRKSTTGGGMAPAETATKVTDDWTR